MGGNEVTEKKELVVKSQSGMLVISNEVVDTYMQASQMLTSKFKEWLIPEVDFTTKIFGKGKRPTLLDPGAGKLIGFFACRPRHRILERFYDKDEEGYESIRYVIATEIIQASTGNIVAEGIGSCSSDEKKYKYRWFFGSELEKMGVNQEERHKLPTRKTGGGYTQYRVRNPEIPDLDNTILKMASKRSEVDGCLQLPGVAAVFTQDVGDYKKPEVQPKEVEVEQAPGKEKPADSEEVKRIKALAKKDLEERLVKEAEKKPPEEEKTHPERYNEERVNEVLRHIAEQDDAEEPEPTPKGRGLEVAVLPTKPPGSEKALAPEPKEEKPPHGGTPRSVDDVTARIASFLPGWSELVKVTEYPDYYRVGRQKTLDKEIENHVDVIVSEMGGEWHNDSNSWRIPKEA